MGDAALMELTARFDGAPLAVVHERYIVLPAVRAGEFEVEF